MESELFSTLEVFSGEASFAAARIYARLPIDARLPFNARLTGRIVGPHRAGGQTLSANVPLRAPLGDAAGGAAGPALLAEATLPDPCFWSPELPFLYTVTVELSQGGQTLARTDRLLGVRPLGVRGGRLWLEGRPWAPRGVRMDETPQADLSDWRDAGVTMIADDPSDGLCQQASRLGVAMIARLSGAEQLAERLRQLARWPSVVMAAIEPPVDSVESLRSAARNLLLVQPVDRVDPQGLSSRAAWADLLICQFAADQDVSQVNAPGYPALAFRPAGAREALTAARRECDRLQAELAGRGEWAGFLV